MNQKSLTRYFNFVIIYICFVIIWGAYVRVTGSGAGCGSHWPLCNGSVIPMEPSLHTKIEFFHRLTSGLSLIFVLLGGYWARKITPKDSFVRKLSKVAVISIIFEALIGAGLVLFELVSHDQSLKRTFSIALHFVNTLILLGSLTLTAKNLPFPQNLQFSWPTKKLKTQTLTFLSLFFLLGTTGAITALGDTLFPSQSLAHGIQADWNSASHFLVRLRILHPIIATVFFLSVIPWIHQQKAAFTSHSSNFKNLQLHANLVTAFLIANIFLGIMNLLLLAPAWLQLMHLFVGLSIWILFVRFLDDLLPKKVH
jgi:heme A synthase